MGLSSYSANRLSRGIDFCDGMITWLFPFDIAFDDEMSIFMRKMELNIWFVAMLIVARHTLFVAIAGNFAIERVRHGIENCCFA